MTTGLDGFFPGLKNFNTQHFANTCMNSADQPQAFLLGSQTYESRLNPHHYNDYNHSYSDYSNPSNNEPSGAHHSENSRLPYNYRPLSSFYDFVETEYYCVKNYQNIVMILYEHVEFPDSIISHSSN